MGVGVAVWDGQVRCIADLSEYDLRPEVLRRVPRALALRYDVLSLASDGNRLTVAVPNTACEDVLDRLRLATGMQVHAVQAPLEIIRAHLHAFYPQGPAQTDPVPRPKSEEAPAIRMLDRIHDRAVLAHASDVHIEPTETGGRIRQRIDGILHEEERLEADLFAPVVSRIKLLAGMDIADRRQPQDGRYTIHTQGRAVDARVSSMPTVSGEKLAIRLLDHQTLIPSLESLGMPASSLANYRRVAHAPSGFVLVCGPTGSGKTTTLYATLAEHNHASQNVCSVEDPVEIRISGVSQVQINERAGLTFATALRAFLRQDPNLIMIGEMRDTETARVGISAALGGQLVLATVHSNDAIGTINRLLELGVERHSLAACLTGIVAQRLVRTLCLECREVYAISERDAQILRSGGGGSAYRARGCTRCGGTGYRGRTGVFEFLSSGPFVRDAIAQGASSVAISDAARDAGYTTMLQNGADKVFAGVTSVDELERVLTFEPCV